MKRSSRTAWFGSDHPAHGEACPTCGARVGRPCIATIATIATIAMPGTCVSVGMSLTGLHADRLAAVARRAA